MNIELGLQNKYINQLSHLFEAHPARERSSYLSTLAHYGEELHVSLGPSQEGSCCRNRDAVAFTQNGPTP